MDEYTKINSVYKRDVKGRILKGDYATDEFEYLADAPWLWTEKVDGTNVRVGVEIRGAAVHVSYGGRTDAAQMPVFLIDKLRAIFEHDGMGGLLYDVLRGADGPLDATLYGEGYGAKIQKGGGNYKPDGCDLVLFDIKIGEWWLRRDAVEEIASKLAIPVVPIVGMWTLPDAVDRTINGEYASAWPNVKPEGLVGRPLVDLFNRKGERIITKVKHKDFAPGRWLDASDVQGTDTAQEEQ